MLLSLRKNGLTSLFKEVRVFKVVRSGPVWQQDLAILSPEKGPAAALANYGLQSRLKISIPEADLELSIFGPLGLQTKVPGREGREQEIPESGYERVQKVFWTPRERKASQGTGAKQGCTGAKQVLEGARDPWETFAPWGSKRPFAPSRNHFREFPVFDPLCQAAWFATLRAPSGIEISSEPPTEAGCPLESIPEQQLFARSPGHLC